MLVTVARAPDSRCLDEDKCNAHRVIAQAAAATAGPLQGMYLHLIVCVTSEYNPRKPLLGCKGLWISYTQTYWAQSSNCGRMCCSLVPI